MRKKAAIVIVVFGALGLCSLLFAGPNLLLPTPQTAPDDEIEFDAVDSDDDQLVTDAVDAWRACPGEGDNYPTLKSNSVGDWVVGRVKDNRTSPNGSCPNPSLLVVRL